MTAQDTESQLGQVAIIGDSRRGGACVSAATRKDPTELALQIVRRRPRKLSIGDIVREAVRAPGGADADAIRCAIAWLVEDGQLRLTYNFNIRDARPKSTRLEAPAGA